MSSFNKFQPSTIRHRLQMININSSADLLKRTVFICLSKEPKPNFIHFFHKQLSVHLEILDKNQATP